MFFPLVTQRDSTKPTFATPLASVVPLSVPVTKRGFTNAPTKGTRPSSLPLPAPAAFLPRRFPGAKVMSRETVLARFAAVKVVPAEFSSLHCTGAGVVLDEDVLSRFSVKVVPGEEFLVRCAGGKAVAREESLSRLRFRR